MTDDPQEAMYLRIGPCPHCDGEVYSHTHYTPRWLPSPPDTKGEDWIAILVIVVMFASAALFSLAYASLFRSRRE